MVEDDYVDSPLEAPTDQIASRVIAVAALVKELRNLPVDGELLREGIALIGVIRRSIKTLPQGGENITAISGGKVAKS